MTIASGATVWMRWTKLGPAGAQHLGVDQHHVGTIGVNAFDRAFTRDRVDPPLQRQSLGECVVLRRLPADEQDVAGHAHKGELFTAPVNCPPW